jgi:CO/xanthine dehydrogenase FAD-binding subunit
MKRSSRDLRSGIALRAKSTYLKFKERESLDFALASAAVALRLDESDGARCAHRVSAASRRYRGAFRRGEVCDRKKLTPDVLAETAKIALADASRSRRMRTKCRLRKRSCAARCKAA